MTPEEQEALSHQHSHGVWVVGITGGFAIFDHPNGKLLEIVKNDAAGQDEADIYRACCEAGKRFNIKSARPTPRPTVSLLDLDL